MNQYSSKSFLLSFFLINLVLSSFYLDDRRNPNSTSRVLQVASISERGSLNIDDRKDQSLDKAFVNDHYYPLQPPMPTFIVFPFYEMLRAIGVSHSFEEDQGRSIFKLGSFIIGSLPFTLLLVLLFQSLRSSGRTLLASVILSTLPLYASLLFIYSGVFYSHLLVALCIYLSYIWISKGKFALSAGFLSGVAFFSEYLTAVIFAIWFFQLLYKKETRAAFYYALGLLPFILGFMAYNYATTGHALHTVYSYNVAYNMTNVGFTYPDLGALKDMLISPWRGAFIFMPVLIPALFAMNWKWPGFRSFVSNQSLLPALIFTLVLSSYEEWHGGWTFGPRYLIPAMILFLAGILTKINLEKWQKWLFWIPVSLGMIYSVMAKVTVGYDIPSKFFYPIVYILGKLKNREFLETGFFSDAHTSAMVFCVLILISFILMFAMSRMNAKD